MFPNKGQSAKSLLTNGINRKSRQQLSEKFMFGSRSSKHGKSFSIGKKFKSSGKGVGSKGSFGGSMKSSSISPSVDEFDSMMNDIGGGGGNKNKIVKGKKGFFTKKKSNAY